MPDLRPSLGTSLAKIANRALRRGLFEVIALGIDRMKEEISSTGSLVMFSADPLGVEPRDVPG
ncbi:MAG TPA: hypothetical protein VG408_02090, partial [Actinomycetota bacterium]|nr:hypothetical protein [Actinomycetota bacterium]